MSLFIPQTAAKLFTNASARVGVWTTAPFREKRCAKNHKQRGEWEREREGDWAQKTERAVYNL